MRVVLFLIVSAAIPAAALASCGNGTQVVSGGDARAESAPRHEPDARGERGHDAPVREDRDHMPEVVPPPPDGRVPAHYCELPGSLVFGTSGTTLVSGGKAAAPPLDWLTLPPGFCAHYFGSVGTTRQMRFAPGGELFVASPFTATAGGAPTGLGAVVVLFDDNHDGYADGSVFPDAGAETLTIFTDVASIQGLMFDSSSFYYQDDTRIMKVAYTSGERKMKGAASMLVDLSAANGRYVSSDHWPKTFDIADDGTIYVANGSDQSQACDVAVFPRPFVGGILKVDGTPGGNPVAQGFRNPIAVRCQRGHDNCFAVELGLDGSGFSGGREKVVPIRQGDDWGFPCCATTGVPYAGETGANCSSVASESVALVIGDTPFGIDFEPGKWPTPFTNDILVVLHGEVGSWTGARVLAVPTDSSGMPMMSSDMGTSTITNLATGWDDGTHMHGRPTAIAFSSDGRAFIGNDWNGDIFWIAPVGLATAP